MRVVDATFRIQSGEKGTQFYSDSLVEESELSTEVGTGGKEYRHTVLYCHPYFGEMYSPSFFARWRRTSPPNLSLESSMRGEPFLEQFKKCFVTPKWCLNHRFYEN